MVDFLNRLMYRDTATVFRSIKAANWGRAAFEQVYKDIPCHLSFANKGDLTAHRDDRAQQITETLKLFYPADFDILENDVVEVFHCGQKFKLVAGTAFKYSTHTELNLTRRKESNQA